MIKIIVDDNSERINYVANVLFNLILNVNYVIIKANEYSSTSEEFVINYSNTEFSGISSIHVSGYLSDSKQITYNDEVVELVSGIYCPLVVGVSASQNNKCTIKNDLFASTFIILTSVLYKNCNLDKHSRIIPNENILPIITKPTVHYIAAYIFNVFCSQKYNFQVTKYKRIVTIDVDRPWLYLHRPFSIKIAGLLKDIIQLKVLKVLKRIKVYLGNRDPFDTYEYLTTKLKNNECIFFWLDGKKNKLDGYHSFEDSAYKDLINNICKLGYNTGIHFSYGVTENPELAQIEKNRLLNIIKAEVSKSRFHFLRKKHPIGEKIALKAGITEEYTTILPNFAGFEHGMAIPFPYFDLQSNTTTTLILHPTHVMDRHLLSYKQLSIDEAIVLTTEIADKVKAVGGVFTLLIHNETVSDYGEWEGWKRWFESVLEQTK